MDLQGHQALQVLKGSRECGVRQESQDLQDNQDHQAPGGYQVCLGKMERLVMMVRQDSQVLRALLDLGDCLACQDCQGSRDIVAFQAWMGQRASKGHQGRRVHKEVQGPLVL